MSGHEADEPESIQAQRVVGMAIAALTLPAGSPPYEKLATSTIC